MPVSFTSMPGLFDPFNSLRLLAMGQIASEMNSQAADDDLANAGQGSGNAAGAESSSSGVYYDTGPLDDGGYWESYDDGSYWWYAEYDASGNQTYYEDSDHMTFDMGSALAMGESIGQEGNDTGAPDPDALQTNAFAEGSGTCEGEASGSGSTINSMAPAWFLAPLQTLVTVGIPFVSALAGNDNTFEVSSDVGEVGGDGHHWVPRSVFKKYKNRISQKVYDLFDNGLKHPKWYIHRYDKWNGVKHSQYNQAVGELLAGFIDSIGGDKNLNERQAQKFLDAIASGDFGDLPEDVVKKFSTQIGKIKKWRSGFLRSMTLVETFRNLDDTLTKQDLKAIARTMDGQDVPLSDKARRAMTDFMGMPKAKRFGLLRKASKVVAGIAIAGFLMDAKEAYADEGAFGVVKVAAADLVWKDVVESGVRGAGSIWWKHVLGVHLISPIHLRRYREFGITPDGEFID